MRNIERVLAHVLQALMGSQGLSYDMTTAQILLEKIQEYDGRFSRRVPWGGCEQIQRSRYREI